MRFLKSFFAAWVLICLSMTQAKALNQSFENDKLFISAEVQKSNHQTHLLFSFYLKNGWHILYQNPGDTGLPTTFKFSNAKGRLIQVSAPKKFDYDGILTQYGYNDKAYYLFELSDINGTPKAEISWMACKDSCESGVSVFELPNQTTMDYEDYYLQALQTFPKSLEKSLTVRAKRNKLVFSVKGGFSWRSPYFIATEKGLISASAPQYLSDGKLVIKTERVTHVPSEGILTTENGSFFVAVEEQKPTLWFLLVIAFVSGILLNLMPCVFPVLSLKAMYLAQNSRKKKGRLARALWYALGVVASFLSMAGLLYLFKKGGAMLGWGFQLQSPIFVLVMIVIFIFILLYLFNILKMKTDYANILMKVSQVNAFFTGFFAVLIASPCTGPFMGALMGYALFESAEIFFPVFAVLGIGYALPFSLLEMYPNFVKRILPKPGKWMVRLKYILSIPIILTVIWLSWIFYHQIRQDNEVDIWMPYSQEKVQEAINNKESVFIDFTAKWCLSCLLNEKTTLNSKAFLQIAQENKIKLFKADWTNKNDEIFKALKLYNRSSVPLYVFYPKDSSYVILPQILTPDMVLTVLNQ